MEEDLKLSKKYKTFIQENMSKLSTKEMSTKMNIGEQLIIRYKKLIEKEKEKIS